MLSQEIQIFAHEAWEKARPSLGPVGEALEKRLNETDGAVHTLTELALGTLPASDVASVPFEVLRAYAEHAVMLRETSPYCRDIPEDIFLHCVFYPRINSEDLVDCRRFFYDQLSPLLKDLSGEEAVLAVNRWCAAQMSYEMTDTRSVNPLTAYSCGLGRCGEESTFGVTALRSVGIPARQIYVPWWSHCDDNHAWVEAYVNGTWHFLGACEPEPALDRGWFVGASSRAMVICSRNYFPFVGEGLKDEGLLRKSGICLAYNQIHRYAECAPVKVTVLGADGKPAAGAAVRFYVENMACHALIAELETDQNGTVSLECGCGSCLAEAEFHQLFAWQKLKISGPTELTLMPADSAPVCGTETWDFEAPETGHKYHARLTPEEQQKKAKILREAAALRTARIQSYQKPEYRTGDEALDRVFLMAGGHAEALWRFWKQYGNEAREILLSLKSKDWRDADPGVLATHIEACRSLPGRDRPEFLPYVACPRIGYELLTDWRSAVKAALTMEEKERFSENPGLLWPWIEKNFREGSCRWHPVLWLQPGAALSLHAADLRGRRLLFVAILRTLGIPARLSPVDGRAQYLKGGTFCTVEADKPQEPQAELTLNAASPMVFEQSWGLSRWCGKWEPLQLEDEKYKFTLPLGLYRLHTVNRLPNGNQLIALRTFSLEQDCTLPLEKQKASPEQLLADYQVQLPVRVSGLELQLYLEPGAEPTEHSLNELLGAKERVHNLLTRGLSLRLFVPDSPAMENPALQKVRKALPEAFTEITQYNDGCLEALARALYLEPGQWPLITLTDGKTSFYGHGGYAVGSVGLALDLAELKLSNFS